MSEEKELQKKELESVDGGCITSRDSYTCCKCCGKQFDTIVAEHRFVGSGCYKYTEYKCPYCGTWN